MKNIHPFMTGDSIWKEIFLSDKTLHLGFENPIAAYGFFIIWGLLSFKVLLGLDKKLK